MSTSIVGQSVSKCIPLLHWPFLLLHFSVRSWHLSAGLVSHLSHLLPCDFSMLPASLLSNWLDLQAQGRWSGHQLWHSPLLVVRITVAIVFGVCAVTLDATGTLLDSWLWTSPVVVLLIGFADPPSVRTPVCKKRESTFRKGPGFHHFNATLIPPSPGDVSFTDRAVVNSLPSTFSPITGIFNKIIWGNGKSSSFSIGTYTLSLEETLIFRFYNLGV
jgi:hypothetical protein